MSIIEFEDNKVKINAPNFLQIYNIHNIYDILYYIQMYDHIPRITFNRILSLSVISFYKDIINTEDILYKILNYYYLYYNKKTLDKSKFNTILNSIKEDKIIKFEWLV